LQEEAETMNCN